MSRLALVGCLWIIAGGLTVAACGGDTKPTTTTVPTSSTSSTTSTTTTTVSVNTTSLRYVGTFTPPPPAPPLPLDLSLFFNLPGGGLQLFTRARPAAIFDVTGGYNTGPGSFTGTVFGKFDGTLEGGGTFTGTMTAHLPGCHAARNYSGSLTRENLNWTPGSHLNTCGGSTPLIASVSPSGSSLPATTSTIVPTTTTTIGSTTTSSSTSSTSTTSTSTTTTSASPQSNLQFTFSPNPASPVFSSTCGTGPEPGSIFRVLPQGQTPHWSWFYSLQIRNMSTVPFTLKSWTTLVESAGGPPNFFSRTNTVNEFVSIYDVTTIGVNATVNGSLCVFLATPPTSDVFLLHTFTGTASAAPFVTQPRLTLRRPPVPAQARTRDSK